MSFAHPWVCAHTNTKGNLRPLTLESFADRHSCSLDLVQTRFPAIFRRLQKSACYQCLYFHFPPWRALDCPIVVTSFWHTNFYKTFWTGLYGHYFFYRYFCHFLSVDCTDRTMRTLVYLLNFLFQLIYDVASNF